MTADDEPPIGATVTVDGDAHVVTVRNCAQYWLRIVDDARAQNQSALTALWRAERALEAERDAVACAALAMQDLRSALSMERAACDEAAALMPCVDAAAAELSHCLDPHYAEDRERVKAWLVAYRARRKGTT